MKIQDLAFATIAELFPELRGVRILELGSGQGALANALSDAGAMVTGLDRTGPARSGDLHLHAFVQHDLNTGTLPFHDGSFDVVVATEVVEHLLAPFLVLAEAVRVLRRQGILVLTMPNYWNLRYRIKYLLSGHMQRPVLEDARLKASYLAGYAPHLTVLPYPALKAVLLWEGCKEFHLRASAIYGWKDLLAWLPVYGVIRVFTAAARLRRSERYFLKETNSTPALLGKRHVLLWCRKTVDSPRDASPPTVLVPLPNEPGSVDQVDNAL